MEDPICRSICRWSFRAFINEIGIGGGHYDRAPATPPGMRVRTGRFEELRSGEAGDTEGIHPPEG
ncbi:hypothetical protein GOC00_30655 [Sinorhizobium meliloti]|nr:hypothetical protein [Sinorhizobium meliloti]MDW9894072.1 hypothetical protein [Sinorhizobium meliloti]MDX0079500.1 hypothetical protein [Sinorhizobium meliloti]MDX0098084.1 hypothetical protein [Sinorhizobium meliloti]